MTHSTAPQSLSQPSWGSHWRAIMTIAAKDWRVYWRYPMNAFSTITQPIIWIIPVYFMGQAFSVNGKAVGFEAYSGTSDYISFALLGMALNNFILAVFWGMGYSIKNDMVSGVLESNWLTPMPRPLLLVGRTFASLAFTTITSLTMLGLAALLLGFHPTGSALKAFLSVVPLLIGLYGFGIAFAALVMVMRDANTMVDVSSFIVQLLSGANFPVTALPSWLLPLALALPLTYGFDAVRGWLLQTETLLPLRVEVGLMIVFMFLMIAFGLWVFQKLERRVRLLGTLGQH
jgi:ABC-2 type transport system permease protein